MLSRLQGLDTWKGFTMTGQEVKQSDRGEQRFFYGYIVAAATFIIMMLAYGTHHVFGIFFKPMLTEFGWTRAMVSGAFSLATIIRGVLCIVMGGLTDRIGPRIVIAACGFLLGLGFLLMSLTNSVWQIYLFYGVITGIGMSGFWVPITSTVARWFTRRRSMMTGVVLAGTGLGTLIFSPVSSRLISAYDWRMSYIIIGGLILVVIVLLAQLLKRDPAQIGQLPYGENKGVEPELKLSGKGFSPGEAFHTVQCWLFFATMICSGFRMSTIIVHTVPHATDLGISPISAANILAIIGGLGIVGRIAMGGIADRIGNRQAFIIGSIIYTAVMLWLPTITEMWAFYLFAVVFGFAGGIAALGSPLIAGLFGLSSHGLIYGVINLGYTIGAAIGPLLAGYIFDVTGSYNIAFFICVALGIASIVMVWLLKPIREKGSLSKPVLSSGDSLESY